MRRLRRPACLLLLCALFSTAAAAEDLEEARLWQERYIWDGLLQSRDRAARSSADPQLQKVVLTIAHQVAQQAANLEQIHTYAKGQLDNLGYAFAQQDPGPSLKIIQNNFQTLAKGTEQIRNNLYYLTTRVRMSSSQALPDPKLMQNATLLIAQVQNVQLKLNDLYTNSAAVHAAVMAETWYIDEFFRFSSSHLLGAVVGVQDAVFAVYNSAYELYVLSKE
ncbi:MAG: hypothetical protein ABIJ96_18445 [Elusimicrobiota bacterium]